MSALMQTILSAVVVAAMLLEGGRCVQWTSGPDDGQEVYVCDGQDLMLSWSVSPDQGEDIAAVTWLFHGNSEQVVAYYDNREFFPMPSYSQRVQHLPIGGLRLSHVTLRDRGTYTVEVSADDGSGRRETYNRSAYVNVATERTARTDVALDIKQEARATYDNMTGEYHLQLTCAAQGPQPPSVIWTTPSQQEVNSSGTDSNGFRLLLPNPVAGGRYSCRVPLDAPAAKCLSSTDPALGGASINVDNMEARMTIVEAEQMALRRENGLKSVQLMTLRQETSSLRQENADLRQQVQALESTTSKKVFFHAYMITNTAIADRQTVVFRGVSVNQGSGYSNSTGRFTAPYSGRYYFSVTTASHTYSTRSNHYGSLLLMVDGSIVSYIVSKSVDYFELASQHYGVHLAQGKQVWLVSYGDNTIQGGLFDMTTFNGFLVSAD